MTKLTLKQIIIIAVRRHGVPIPRYIFVDDPLDLLIVLRVQDPGRPGPELQRHVVALADAAGGELEPLREDTATLVARVVR